MSQMPYSSGDADVNDLGRALCQSLYASTKLTALYGFESQVPEEAIDALMAAIGTISKEFGDCRLRMSNEAIYLNDQRMRSGVESFMAARYVVDMLIEREVGEIHFEAKTPRRDVVALLRAFNAMDRESENPREQIKDLVREDGVETIHLSPIHDMDDQQEEEALDVRDASIQTYFRGMFIAQKMLTPGAVERGLELRKAKRIVQQLVDLALTNEHTLIGLVQVKAFHDFMCCHAANVAVLCIVMGKRLGLPKPRLADIGLCGMLHDIGRVGLDDTDPAAHHGHARRGAHLLLKGLGFSDSAIRTLLAALGHHEPAMNDRDDWAPLFHRVVRVCDFYDTLTTPAGEELAPVPAREVLEVMARDEGKIFDRRLVRLLGSIMGAYPIGTVVSLDNGADALVCGRGSDQDDPLRPMVRVFSGEADGMHNGILDLADPTATCEYSIAQAWAPSETYAETSAYVDTL